MVSKSHQKQPQNRHVEQPPAAAGIVLLLEAHGPKLTSTLTLLTAALSSSDFLLLAELGRAPLHHTGHLARRVGGPGRGSASGTCSGPEYAQYQGFIRHCISAASI